MGHHAQLGDSIEDQLSLAATHYVRSHLQEAMDVYVKLLLENREYLALHVYTALCYSKLVRAHRLPPSPGSAPAVHHPKIHITSYIPPRTHITGRAITSAVITIV